MLLGGKREALGGKDAKRDYVDCFVDPYDETIIMLYGGVVGGLGKELAHSRHP